MEWRKLEGRYGVYENRHELDTDVLFMIDEARLFAANAYAPYSKFKVSALLQLESGIRVKATNVENASFPVSVCAERNLISATISNYPGDKIKLIVVYVDKHLIEPASPCGMCRQALVEAEQNQGKPIVLYLVSGNSPVYRFDSCLSLLPLAFRGENIR